MTRAPEAHPGYLAATVAGGRAALVLWSPASPGAVDRAAELLRPRLEDLAAADELGWIDFQVQVASALEDTHAEVLELVDHGHAVTATLLVLGAGGFRLAHLGAGRPLVLHKGVVHPLTREHTRAFALYEEGEIRASELSARAGTSALTKGLGFPGMDPMEATSAAFRRGDLHPGWSLLLPAGSLQATLGESGILELLRAPASPEEAMADLAAGWTAEGLAGATLLRVESPEAPLELGTTGVLGVAPGNTAADMARAAAEGPEEEADAAPEAAPETPPDTPSSEAAPADMRDPEALPEPDPLEDPPALAGEAPATPTPLPSSPSTPPAPRPITRDRRSRRRRRSRGRRKERWVAIDQESRLDDPVVLGGWLVAASLGVLGLLYWCIHSLLPGG